MEEIELRLASSEDIDAINAFYNRIYKKNRTRAQFEWEYLSAPAGKAIYVLAELNGRIVGTQCAIPYFITDADNRTVLSAKSEDTLVDPEQRGKSIFEKMYFLLFMECRKAGIRFIWGFTYAEKPFLKLGFDIPYRSSLGLTVIKPLAAYRYYSSLSKENTLLRKMKILGMCLKSYLNHPSGGRPSSENLQLSTERFYLNDDRSSYLRKSGMFGLKLDREFLDYRMYRNAYSANYRQLCLKEGDAIRAGIYYTVNNGLCYLLHFHFEDQGSGDRILAAFFGQPDVKECYTVRFWGFRHNDLQQQEIGILKRNGFLFIDRGISFVGLNLDDEKRDWSSFHLSRLASQGTD